MKRRTVLSGGVITALGLAAVGLAAPPAQAAVTSSNVTSPSNGTHYMITDANPAQGNVVVTGTSNGTTGDLVDLRCYTRVDRWNSVHSNVAVQANGTFSTTMSTGSVYGTCILRAVPAGHPAGASISAYTGPRLTAEEITSQKVPSGPNAGKTYDYYVLFQGSHAMNDYVSATGGGLWDSRLSYSDGTSSNYLWYSNAALTGNEGGATRSFLRVDGHDAYGPDSAHSLFADNPGLPSLTYTASRNATTGVTTIRESNPIVRCPSDTFPPDSGSCAQFVSTGVRLERTIVTNDGGRQVHITDVWRSTDGHSHTVSPHYDNWTDAYNPTTDSATEMGLRLPWLGGYQTFTGDAVLAGPGAAPRSIFVRDSNTAPDGDTSYPLGAISFDHAPSQIRRVNNYEFVLRDESVAVPAGGVRLVRQDFVLGLTQAEVTAKAAANAIRINPYRPDALLRKHGATAYVGSNIYNTTASGQTTLRKARRGAKATFDIAVQNDGSLPNTFRVRGQGNKRGFTVKYFAGLSGTTDITTAVTAGTYTLTNLPVGATRYLRIVVKVKAGTPIGRVRDWLATVTSAKDGTMKDAVRAKVKVRAG
jgi:hypothetical protein